MSIVLWIQSGRAAKVSHETAVLQSASRNTSPESRGKDMKRDEMNQLQVMRRGKRGVERKLRNRLESFYGNDGWLTRTFRSEGEREFLALDAAAAVFLSAEIFIIIVDDDEPWPWESETSSLPAPNFRQVVIHLSTLRRPHTPIDSPWAKGQRKEKEDEGGNVRD